MSWDPRSLALSRFGFGPTPTDRVMAFDPDAWWANQVAVAQANPGYSDNSAVAAVGPLLTQTPAQVRAWLKAQGEPRHRSRARQRQVAAGRPSEEFRRLRKMERGRPPAALDQGDVPAANNAFDVLGELLQTRLGIGSLSTIFPSHSYSPLGISTTSAPSATATPTQPTYTPPPFHLIAPASGVAPT